MRVRVECNLKMCFQKHFQRVEPMRAADKHLVHLSEPKMKVSALCVRWLNLNRLKKSPVAIVTPIRARGLNASKGFYNQL